MTMMPSLFTPIMASGAASSIAWKIGSPVAGEGVDLRCSRSPSGGARTARDLDYRGAGLRYQSTADT